MWRPGWNKRRDAAREELEVTELVEEFMTQKQELSSGRLCIVWEKLEETTLQIKASFFGRKLVIFLH